MSGILIGNGTVVTLGSDNQLIEQGAVLVQDSRIAAIGSDTTLRQQHPAAQYVDAYGGLIMPGFLCTHTHFYGAFARGMAIPGEAPRNFPEILERLWWRLDKLLTLEDARASAEILVRFGEVQAHRVAAVRHRQLVGEGVAGHEEVVGGPGVGGQGESGSCGSDADANVGHGPQGD